MKKKNNKRKGKRKANNKNNGNTIVILAGIAFGFILVFGILAGHLLIKMNILSVKPSNATEGPFIEVTDEGDEEDNVKTLNELRSEGNLSSILKDWATNTSEEVLMHSKDVINVLLIGLDEKEINSDAIILASLNQKTDKIYLTSVFRDSYTYISTSEGDKYSKINACYANGGAQKLIETIQNDFKVKIDYYVSINFESFKGIVDIFGGVTLDVKPYEAYAIGMGCPSGENVRLNGEQALQFCRIRHCDVDADVSRTRRQRQFINAVIEETKNISISQISPLLNTVVKYIKTDCSVGNMLSLGTKAISEKWYNYEIISNAIPSEEHRLDFRGNAWVWIVDYPASAKLLHETIYGYSNIELQDERLSAIEVMKTTHNSGDAHP